MSSLGGMSSCVLRNDPDPIPRQSGRFSLTPSQSFFLEGVQRSAAWIDLRSEISRTKSASRRTYQDRMLGRDAEACRLTRSWSLSALMIWAIC
ncbi:hypothetical protein AcW1_001418 [Taiwanofungus camphoratus]|nr:hypothetical protein AcW2_000052 [Antrodia cinnamomea]KAI0964647.1 hypothetical protein AcW1_001418 [Antrodia cinnamomea]